MPDPIPTQVATAQTPADIQSQYGALAVAPTAPTVVPAVTAPQAPTASEVMAPANVLQTMTAPVAPYDYTDPLKLRDRINNELGLTQVQSDYQKAIDAVRAFDTGTTNQQFNIDQELNPLGVIRGEQATALGQRSLSRQGFADTAQALSDRYNAIQSEANNRFNILNAERSTLQGLMVNNPGAKITYTDTVESANKKVADYAKKQQKAAEKKAKQDEKDAYKKALKSTALQLGLDTSGSRKDLEARLRTEYASDAAYKKKIQQLELASKQKALASGGASGTSNLNSLLAKAAQMPSGGREWAASVAKTYGVNPTSVAQATAQNGWEGAYRTGTTNATAGGNIKLSAAQKDDIATMDTLSQMAQGIQTTLGKADKGYVGIGGLGAGSVSQFMRTNFGAGSDEQQQVRDTIANIAGTIAKLRGGTSFTANEQALLERYTPTINETPASASKKLKDLTEFISLKKQNTLNVAGGDFSGGGTGVDEEQQLRDAGYTQEQIDMLKSQ